MSVTNVGGVARHGAYAHFPGTGPKFRCCMHCTHFVKKEIKAPTDEGRCRKYAEIMGVPVRKAGWIRGYSAACKYYEQKPTKGSLL